MTLDVYGAYCKASATREADFDWLPRQSSSKAVGEVIGNALVASISSESYQVVKLLCSYFYFPNNDKEFLYGNMFKSKLDRTQLLLLWFMGISEQQMQRLCNKAAMEWFVKVNQLWDGLYNSLLVPHENAHLLLFDSAAPFYQQDLAH